MNKSKIEWCDYTWNPIKGYCPHDCPYCYSHRMYNRFGWDRTLRFDESVFKSLKTIKKPSRIFVGSMIDMYHEDIHSKWIKDIIYYSKEFPQHTFITLTKYPDRLKYFEYLENWWIGTTLTTQKSFNDKRLIENKNIKGKRFISFEPLLSWMYDVEIYEFDWIIVGGLTPKPVHKNEWIDDIISRADDFNIPVFIKNNAHYPIVRKEFPV